MGRYDRGFERGSGWARPGGEVDWHPRARARPDRRPWVGGYREGYQGGSGGIRTTGARSAPYARDYWWLGERELDRRGRAATYDQAYRRFDARSHPQYSPVGGTYPAMGGEYRYRRPPRPLRDDTWFSDWTRWF